MPLLNRKYPWAADIVSLANRGSQTGITGDLRSRARAAEKLTVQIRAASGGG
jgi:hypothetical protein